MPSLQTHWGVDAKASPARYKFVVAGAKSEVVIIANFVSIPGYNLLARNVISPGFSRRDSAVHCTASVDICQLVTDEYEINAALSTSALIHSPFFNLTQFRFLLAGDGAISPKQGISRCKSRWRGIRDGTPTGCVP
ncbi:hypothetical protein BD309DRAFT_1021642 [Dichomitus squalens]|uniref:Uncharacterized protein n=1 Tax=Dichomitus squalens TaxID=114155 RepID=A0A4Q9PVG3_9APHY|nr:hypothetical protein BD309DRAFT_1021642 [Dichomitus squalens]TBU58485.1 hypothetical protein BD310DRAFT_977331 [Dichomitus squalens]